MQKVLTAEEMREVDRRTVEEFGVPSLILMENAAHAAARAILGHFGGSAEGRNIAIFCGKGNNGGDGAALARILWTLGADVWVYLFGRVDETTGDARVNLDFVAKVDLDPNLNGPNGNCLFIREILNEDDFRALPDDGRAHVVVDAVFGTGLARPLSGFAARLVRYFNLVKRREPAALIVSLDVPSGVAADRSAGIGPAVEADLTVTFTAPKIANVLPPVSRFSGRLVVAKIGSPQSLIDEAPSRTFVAERRDARNWLHLSAFSDSSYKNKRGHTLLVAGSRDYAGAGVLAGNAAMVSGAGLVTVATPESARASIAARALPEVMTRGVAETAGGAVAAEAFGELDGLIEKNIDAVLIGSGLSSDESTAALVAELVAKRRTPVVLDADALNSLAPFAIEGSDERPLVVTPHEGEFKRLCGIEAMPDDRVGAAREFATKHRVILVLKGERALVAAPDGRVVINPTGNSGLGKAGNGDTLAGIIVGFIAQAARMKIDIFETVVAAVYISGLAGDIAAEKFGKRTMLASDVRESLGEAFKRVEE